MSKIYENGMTVGEIKDLFKRCLKIMSENDDIINQMINLIEEGEVEDDHVIEMPESQLVVNRAIKESLDQDENGETFKKLLFEYLEDMIG